MDLADEDCVNQSLYYSSNEMVPNVDPSPYFRILLRTTLYIQYIFIKQSSQVSN